MAGQTWGPPALEKLALTLRMAAVMFSYSMGGKAKKRTLESSAIAGEKKKGWLGEEGVGLRTGGGHEIFVTSQDGSLSGSGSSSGPVQVQAPPRVAQLDLTGTDASSTTRSGSTSVAAQRGIRSRRC